MFPVPEGMKGLGLVSMATGERGGLKTLRHPPVLKEGVWEPGSRVGVLKDSLDFFSVRRTGGT